MQNPKKRKHKLYSQTLNSKHKKIDVAVGIEPASKNNMRKTLTQTLAKCANKFGVVCEQWRAAWRWYQMLGYLKNNPLYAPCGATPNFVEMSVI